MEGLLPYIVRAITANHHTETALYTSIPCQSPRNDEASTAITPHAVVSDALDSSLTCGSCVYHHRHAQASSTTEIATSLPAAGVTTQSRSTINTRHPSPLHHVKAN
ncbi:hypothetical protein KP509_09G005000 [Ceratopteris richardii]|uniref:Uncharacterized protein n=1 Tax=Ceratopteris richardii TaxID=49495 RepID=A0A8T2U442_CERRI|nr:hypothetical protein KP509_09G005000 [Ceratopteris richardii]